MKLAQAEEVAALKYKLLLISESPFWKRHLLDYVAEAYQAGKPLERPSRTEGSPGSTLYIEITVPEIGALRVIALPSHAHIDQSPIELERAAIFPIFFFQQSRDETHGLALFRESLELLAKRVESKQCIILLGLGAEILKKTLRDACESLGYKALILASKATDYENAWRQIKRHLCKAHAEKEVAPAFPAASNGEQFNQGEINMAGIADSLKKLMEVDGAKACALVDYNSGMVLGKAGSGVDLDVAGSGNCEVLKAKFKVMKALGIGGGIEDMLITLGDQYHILRPLTSKPGLFVYFVLDKAKANLGMARYKTGEIEAELTV